MKLSFTFLLFVLLAALVHSSCDQKQPKEKDAEKWDVENTRIVESFDDVNSLAIKNAQDSLGMFIKFFEVNQNGNFEFYIKSKFSEGKTVENMWSTVHSIHGDSLFATLNNVPLKLTAIKLNDKVILTKKDIEDWTIYQGDSVVLGNFMVRNHE